MLEKRFGELDKLGNPTIAFQASGIDGIKVRVVAKCDDEATAVRILDAEEQLIRGLLGDVVFGIDEQSMETVVLDLLRRKGLTVAAAETISGGILSARMSAADVAMETFRGARIAPGNGSGWRPDAGPACRRGRRAGARGVRHARGPRRHRPGCCRGLQARVPFFSPPTSTGCCTPRR